MLTQCKDYGSLTLSRRISYHALISIFQEYFIGCTLSLIPVHLRGDTKIFPSPHTYPLYYDPSLSTLIILHHPVLKRIHLCATCSLLSFFQWRRMALGVRLTLLEIALFPACSRSSLPRKRTFFAVITSHQCWRNN